MKAVVGIGFVFVACLSPVTLAQDFLRGLKDIGKTIEKVQKPQKAQETRQNTIAPATADTSFCLDDICIGDGIEKLTNFQWISNQEWIALDGARRQAVDKGLTDAIGKRNVDLEKKRNKEMEKIETAGLIEDRLKRRIGGRMIADPSVTSAIGRMVIDQSTNRFDNALLPLLAQVTAVCFSNFRETKGTKFVGALRKESPNKTLVLIEVVHDESHTSPQRFAVTSIARIFDVSTGDQGAMAGLIQSINSQFPNVYVIRGQSYKDGFNLRTVNAISYLGTSATNLFGEQSLDRKSRPELLVVKGEYDGVGNVDQSWNLRPQIPPVCKQAIRTD